MRYAFFPGCKIPFYLPQYGRSARGVLDALDVELVELEFNCCGYPNRDVSFDAFVLSSARNMALARANGLDILTPCKCCYGSLKNADYWLGQKPALRERINSILAEEGLTWVPGGRSLHLLQALKHDIGPEAIKAGLQRPLNGLKAAVHYGCHALRPASVTGFDDPFAPTIFENILSLTGTQCLDWPRRLECCGHPLWQRNNDLSLRLRRRKIQDARACGADLICVACTHCQIQFDQIHDPAARENDQTSAMPSVLLTQLLGLSLGLDESALQIDDRCLQIMAGL